MRVLRIKNRYDSRIWLDDKTKRILKMDCSCWNFVNKRIKKVGKVHDIKYYANEPCKHLSLFIETLQKQGYKIKTPKIGGSNKLTSKIRKMVLEVWGNECFFPECNETKNLQIHRLHRGNTGGKYSVINCRPYCPIHHKKIHEVEFI